MQAKISQLIRSIFGFGLLSVILIIALLTHVWLLFSNYNGVVQSFELLGYDQKPISESPLFGWVFEALLLGDATLCELYAGALILAMCISMMIVCHLATQLITLIRDRTIFLRTGDENSARNVEITILYSLLPWFILWVPLAIIITLWDVKLFGYRATAGLMELDSVETVLSLKNLGILHNEYSDRFAINLTKYSQWGYASAILATSLFIEFIFIKFRERWELLEDSFASFAVREASNRAILQPQINSEGRAVSANQIRYPEENVSNNSEPSFATNLSDSEPDGLETESDNTAISMDEESDTITPLQHTGFDLDEEVEVITSTGRKQVRRSQAYMDPDIYFDGVGGFWDREYYESLHR